MTNDKVVVKKLVTILAVGDIQETKTGKEYRVLKVQTPETVINVNVFLGRDGDTLLERGQSALMEMTETTYKGKKQYSSGMWLIEKVRDVKDDLKHTEEKDAHDDSDHEQQMWQDKELRGHRRACLAIAASLLTDKQKDSLGEPDAMAGMIILISRQLLDEVYGIKGDNLYDRAKAKDLPEDMR